MFKPLSTVGFKRAFLALAVACFMFTGVPAARAALEYNFTTLDDPLGVDTYATGICGNTVVGTYVDSQGLSHGFIYNGSTYTILDDPSAGSGGAQGTYLSGISGNTIVGYYGDANTVYHGFTYNGSDFTTLDDPLAATGYGAGTVANGVSGTTVVGTYYNNSGNPQGFIYNASTFTTLGDPLAGIAARGFSL